MAETMIDIETLGYRPDTTILTLGAVKFDPYSDTEPGPGLYLKFNVDQQTALGRSTDESTIQWWGEQNAEVREEAMGLEGRTDLEEAIDQFHKFVWGSDCIWAQGPQFDIIILESLYGQLKRPLSWTHGQIRDSRTVFKLGIDPEMNKGDAAHNALVDAYWQARGVQNVFRKLGIKKS